MEPIDSCMCAFCVQVAVFRGTWWLLLGVFGAVQIAPKL